MHAFAVSPERLARELTTNLELGLAREEAGRRLARDGPNELPKASPVSAAALLLSQFSSLIVWVLTGAAVVSGLLREWVDTVAILAIVLLNAVLGFIQEYKAERSLAALRRLSVNMARVIREGRTQMLPARELIAGDVIQLEAGDHVPADARLVYATALQTQEASLTGESLPVEKTAETLEEESVPLGDRRNMVFLGTAVTSGRGRAVVVATGLATELGRIAQLMQGDGRDQTPVQRKLEHLGHFLLGLTLAIVAVVFVAGLLGGEPLMDMFLTAVSLAVAAIPEGLPAIVTMTLAIGVHRMAARHALVRRLPAVETLGSVTVICSDKTGTLTKNEMTVTRLFVGQRTLDVSGEGYEPTGEIRERGRPLESRPFGLTDLLTAAVLCNGSTLREDQGAWQVLGDPTEGALLVAAAKMGLRKESLEAEHAFLGEVPFDPERKMMTVVRAVEGRAEAYVKGAPDVLLLRCSRYADLDGKIHALDKAARDAILSANRGFARAALRVLGIARRPLKERPSQFQAKALEHDLIFLGLAAMKDPIRPEAKSAIHAAHAAGIRTVMITGDHKETAVAIGHDLGIDAGEAAALSGAELNDLSEADLAARVDGLVIYARVSAEHKLRIVKAWRARGAIVAMTGDGVNDAPAVKAADIGVAMGITGTDVTKEASDMVVTDDNFASITAAVEEGRRIYANIRKAVQYLLSCNTSEVLLMLLATLGGLPLPLLPVQILWINLVTDGFPALALAMEPLDPDLMTRPPRPADEKFLDRPRVLRILAEGAFIALLAIVVFGYGLYAMELGVERARTMTFTVLVLAQLFHAFNCRSRERSVFDLGLFSNKPLLLAVAASAVLQAGILAAEPLRTLFRVTEFTASQWALALMVGSMPLLLMEVWKGWRRRNRHTRQVPPHR